MIEGTSKLCIHTITTKPWSTENCIRNYSNAGVKGISFWRYSLEGRNPETVGRQARESGLDVVSLVRGGFFPSETLDGRQKAIDENRAILDEAAAVGAPIVVLVCGAVPGQALEESRKQITEGIAACLDHAKSVDVGLSIEPLHPMYADSRSAINTMEQANTICEQLGSPKHVGIAADVYHLWWDPNLEQEIARSGKNGNLDAFHICDWKTPTLDLLNDRGLMGEGCINIPQIRGWAEGAGFSGYHEVEIFSDRYWAMDQGEYLDLIVKAYLQHS